MSTATQSPAAKDYEPTSTCLSRVYVNGTRIPTAEVDVRLRKEGPLGINRYAEANFASPWGDQDYLSLFGQFNDDLSETDTLRIDVRDQKEETYQSVFNGVVTGVGNSHNDNRKIHRVRARGPELFLDKIPASKRFTNDTSVADILGYVLEELNKNFAMTIDSGGFGDSTVDDVDETDLFSAAQSLVEGIPIANNLILSTLDDLTSEKTFQRNKHNLSDVTDWLQDKIQSRIWIQPTQEGGQLLVTSNPVKNNPTHRANYLNNGQTRIIENNALVEIKPINTIVVKGGTRRSVENPGAFGYEARGVDKKFTTAKARHTELYDRANGKELSDTVVKTDATTVKEVENEAKSILKKKVDEATSGEITITHDRLVQPYDTVVAKPTVNAEDRLSIDPIEYEVSRCHYKVRPNDNDVVHHINLTCGIQTDIENDIEIIRSWDRSA